MQQGAGQRDGGWGVTSEEGAFFGGLISGLAIMGFVAFLWAGLIATPRDYKAGQIDALTGTVKYELIEHDDGTKTWERTPNKEQGDE